MTDDSADRWLTSQDHVGLRLDRHLAERYDKPRNRIQQWIHAGRVEVDGRAAKPAHRLVAGESIVCRPLQLTQPEELVAEPGELELLHEEAEFIVLAKPAGLVVHPGAGASSGTLAHYLLHHFPQTGAVGGPGRPGIVHRLDRETSGVMVVALTETAYLRLSEAFAARAIGKLYLAAAYGRGDTTMQTEEGPIGRHPHRRQLMTVRPDGRPACTEYRALGVAGSISLFEVRPVTGRTHQIRVHLKSAGHPIVGDSLYGEARWKNLHGKARGVVSRFHRTALHAWRLRLMHPESGRPMEFVAPPPADLQELWHELSGELLAAALARHQLTLETD